jgi:hypothetical protein
MVAAGTELSIAASGQASQVADSAALCRILSSANPVDSGETGGIRLLSDMRHGSQADGCVLPRGSPSHTDCGAPGRHRLADGVMAGPL